MAAATDYVNEDCSEIETLEEGQIQYETQGLSLDRNPSELESVAAFSEHFRAYD